MSEFQLLFDAAVAQSRALTERPDNATLLKIYGLYKQATAGDNQEKKPAASDLVGHAQWEAWDACRGLDSDAAKQQYIDLIKQLP